MLEKPGLKEKLEKVKLLALDFDGVMTDNRVLVFDNGKEAVFCNRGDGLGIELLKKAGIGIIVISKEKNKVVLERCKKLKIKCLSGAEDKYTLLLKEAKRRNLSLEEICFIGNDINDLKCLKNAGLGFGVADSHESVLGAVDFITEKKGGEGAVREVIDLILKSKNKDS